MIISLFRTFVLFKDSSMDKGKNPPLSVKGKIFEEK